MSQYAYFNSSIVSPSPVIGWYDTDKYKYANFPATTDLLQVTADQWAARMSNPSGWAVSNGALVAYTPPAPTQTAAQQLATFKHQIMAALTDSDITVHRVAEGVSLGLTSWTAADVVTFMNYRRALRALLDATTVSTLPARPAYPVGT